MLTLLCRAFYACVWLCGVECVFLGVNIATVSLVSEDG